MGLLTTDDSPVIWRGPILHSVIRQFFQEVSWASSTTSSWTCRPARAMSRSA